MTDTVSGGLEGADVWGDQDDVSINKSINFITFALHWGPRS
jgi:hypothetical protein